MESKFNQKAIFITIFIILITFACFIYYQISKYDEYEDIETPAQNMGIVVDNKNISPKNKREETEKIFEKNREVLTPELLESRRSEMEEIFKKNRAIIESKQ